jgi:hypothetical protein
LRPALPPCASNRGISPHFAVGRSPKPKANQTSCGGVGAHRLRRWGLRQVVCCATRAKRVRPTEADRKKKAEAPLRGAVQFSGNSLGAALSAGVSFSLVTRPPLFVSGLRADTRAAGVDRVLGKRPLSGLSQPKGTGLHTAFGGARSGVAGSRAFLRCAYFFACATRAHVRSKCTLLHLFFFCTRGYSLTHWRYRAVCAEGWQHRLTLYTTTAAWQSRSFSFEKQG